VGVFWIHFWRYLDKKLDISSKCGGRKEKGLEDQGLGKIVVERRRIELPTFALRTRRSPS
jgi:hypothetical protein